MYQVSGYEAVQADRQRQVAWADRNAWMVAEVEYHLRRQRRARVARVLRALAARLDAVEAGSVGERRPVAAEQGA